MATFARGVEPGTFTKVILEPVPQLVPTSFVTGLIGTTGKFKPTSKILNRNESDGWETPIDQTTGANLPAVSKGENEPRRVDNLETLALANKDDVSSINSITDEAGITHLEGEDQQWISKFWTPPDGTGDQWVIEWVTKYRMQLNHGDVVSSAANGGAPVEFARVDTDSLFTRAAPEFIGAIGVDADDVMNIRVNGEGPVGDISNGRYVLVAASYGTGADRGLSFAIHETDANGDPVSTTPDSNNVGSIGINIGTAPLVIAGFNGGSPIPAGPTGNVFYGDGTAKDFAVTASQTANGGDIVIEFNLKNVESPTVNDFFKLRVNATDLLPLLDAITASPAATAINYINVSVAGPAIGYDADTVDPGTPVIGTGADTAGTRYTVEYRRIKTVADLEPLTFDNVRDLQDFHGAIDSSTGVDALSFGAVPYFRQGGGPVIAVPLRDNVIDPTSGFDLSVDAEYVSAVEEALEKLEDVEEVTMVIPLSPTETGTFRPGILSNVKSHVLRMSTLTERKPRMAILGARANTTDQDVFINNAKALKSNRLIYVAPATATLTTSGVTKLCDGSTIAAAIAGVNSDPNVDAGAPLEVQITAFDDIPDPFTRTQKNRIGEINGVTIIEKKSGTPKVRHFLTTDLTSSLTAEGKVTRIEIDVRRSLQTALDNILINTRFVDGQTIGTASSIIGLILNQKIESRIINDFRIDKAQRNAAEPRQLDVELSIRPVFNLNWIFIQATFLAS